MSALHYSMIFGLLGIFSVSVVWGLWWAIRGGQFSEFQRGATSIFGPDEPQGYRTDAFPGEERPHKAN